MRWSAPDTLIDGSPSSSVTFVVNGDITVTPLDRHDVYQRVWSSATEWVDHGPFLWGVPATLESPGTGFESDAGGYDGFSNTATVQVVPGTLDADLRARYGSGGEVSHHVVWNGGGYGVIAVRGLYTLMDEQAASFLGVASFSAWGNGRAVAIPDIGYTYVDRAVPFGFYDEPATVTLEFVSLAELKLKVDVEGEGGDPECAGYITADGAKAYFGGFSLVRLEAVPQPGYVFSHWTGRGTAFIADDHDDPADERSLESEESPITNDEIWITMRDQDGLTSRDITAVFSRTGTVVSTRLADDELLPTMRGIDLGIPSAIHNETAIVTFVNLKLGDSVSATIIPIGNAKGHEQYNGTHTESDRANKLGSLSAHTVSSDGGCEVHTWTIKPSDFSGRYAVRITVDNETIVIPFTVKVPGLVPVEEGERIHLYQSLEEREHIHSGHYHLTPDFLSILEAIADTYRNVYPDRPLWVNDCSLAWGGRFDYLGDWAGSHKAHRRGLEADIGTHRQYPDTEFPGEGAEQAARIQYLKDVINSMNGVRIVPEGVIHHIHIRAK